jgi:hypothetical protein
VPKYAGVATREAWYDELTIEEAKEVHTIDTALTSARMTITVLTQRRELIYRRLASRRQNRLRKEAREQERMRLKEGMPHA